MILAASLNIAIPASATVVGRDGAVYPIAERDMIDVIEERAAQIDQGELLRKMQDKIRQDARTFRPEDSVDDLPRAASDEVYRVDLSYRVPQDIVDLYGQVIYPEGYVFNPLALMRERGIGYPFVIVVLNAASKVELEWFKASGLNGNPRVRLWITDGHAYELAEELKRPVYYLTRRIQSRFSIRATPSLVYWPQGDDHLAVRTLALPLPPETSPADAGGQVLEAVGPADAASVSVPQDAVWGGEYAPQP